MNQFQKIFDAQKALFATGVITQLRMARRPTRSHGSHDQGERGALPAGDGKGIQRRPRSEYMLRDSSIRWRERGPEEPAERVDEAGRSHRCRVPPGPKTGHRGMIYREPYGVALIIGPFNGPLLLLIRPALAALAAGNTCILTLSEALPETTKVLLDLCRRNISIRAP